MNIGYLSIYIYISVYLSIYLSTYLSAHCLIDMTIHFMRTEPSTPSSGQIQNFRTKMNYDGWAR